MYRTLALIALYNAFIYDVSGNDLLDYLYSKHDVHELPRRQDVVVKISMALRMVVGLDAKNQELVTSMWVRQSWHDPRLTWNIRNFSDKGKTPIPQGKIWKPDFVLYDNTDFLYSGEIRNVYATAWYNGTVSLVYPALFKSACQINIFYFPFDEQICKMSFGSWTYDSTILKFELDGDRAADLKYYEMNSEWLLLSFTAEVNDIYQHDCCPKPMHDVTYSISLRRRSIMLFYYLYFPNILINLIAMFQFLLPCDSTEKVTLGITILLAMIVYLLLMEEMLPTTEVVPIIVHYMSVTLGLVTVSLLVTIIVLEVHHNGKHDNHSQLPAWARKYILHGLAKFLQMDQYITTDQEREQKLNTHVSRISAELFAEEEEDPFIQQSPFNYNLHNNNYNLHNKNYNHHNKTSSRHKSNRPHSLHSAFSSSIYKVSPMDAPESAQTAVDDVNFADTAQSTAEESNPPDNSSNVPSDEFAAHRPYPHTSAQGLKPLSLRSQRTTPITGQTSVNVQMHQSDHNDQKDMLLLKILHYCEDFAERAVTEDRESELACEWQQMAMLLDRLFFIIYLIITIIVWVVVLRSRPEQDQAGIK